MDVPARWMTFWAMLLTFHPLNPLCPWLLNTSRSAPYLWTYSTIRCAAPPSSNTVSEARPNCVNCLAASSKWACASALASCQANGSTMVDSTSSVSRTRREGDLRAVYLRNGGDIGQDPICHSAIRPMAPKCSRTWLSSQALSRRLQFFTNRIPICVWSAPMMNRR